MKLKWHRFFSTSTVLAVYLATAALPTTATAYTYTWANSGTSSGYYWSDSGNWTGGSTGGTPGTADTVALTNGGVIDLNGNAYTVTGVGISSSSAIKGSIIDGSLTVTGSDVYLTSGTLSANLTLTNSHRLWIGGDTSANVYLGGSFSSNYSGGLGNGVVIGYNTQSGLAGTVTLLSANALGNTGAAVYSGTLDLNGQNGVTTPQFNLFGGFYGGTSSLINSSSTAVATSAKITLGLAGSTTLGGDGNLTLSGIITNNQQMAGDCGFTKIGSGALTLSGVNTYTGATFISGGTLLLGNSLALQSSTLNYNNYGGALSFGVLTSASLGGLSGSQSLSLVNTAGSAVAMTVGLNGTSTTYSGVLSGSGSLIKKGAGVLTLSGVNTYTGATYLNAGTLAYGVKNAISTGSSVSLYGGELALGAYSGAITGLTLSSGAVTGSGTLSVTGNDVVINSGTMTANLNMLNNHRVWIGGSTSANVYLGGTLTIPTGSFTNGVVVGYQTSTGAAGTVTLTSAAALGSAIGVSIYAGTLDLNGQSAVTAPTFNLYGGSPGNSVGTASLVNNSSTAASTNAAVVLQTAGSNTLGGNGNLTVNGVVSGYGFTKIGSGMLTLSNANTYTGTTTVSAGTVNVTGSIASHNYAAVRLTALNAVTGDAPTIAQSLASGASLSNYGSTGVGNATTYAAFLAGQTTAATTLAMSWRDASTNELNGGNGLVSEVLNLSLANTSSYVLKMSYGATSSSAGLYVVYTNQNNGLLSDWTSICVGSNLGAYSSSYTTVGEWGIDTTTNTIWVVANETAGSFAVAVPEPGTLALLIGAALGLFAFASRRRKHNDLESR